MDKTSESDNNDSEKLSCIKNEKKENNSSKGKHCLCDSKDYSTFMICCDFCGVWYHGDCVQVFFFFKNILIYLEKVNIIIYLGFAYTCKKN